MDLKNCLTAIFVEDIRLSKDFYTETLGMEIELDFGKNVIFKNGLTIWEIQESHIIPQTLGVFNLRNHTANRFELYFETEEIDEIYYELKEKEVRFLHELHEESWGQQTIRFFDPDDHLIEVGESMRMFVTRFHDQGMTALEISQRTHVPVDEVIRLISHQQ